MSEHVIEYKKTTETTRKSRRAPVYNYEIIRKGTVVGHISTTDRDFADYLFGLGCNVIKTREIYGDNP